MRSSPNGALVQLLASSSRSAGRMVPQQVVELDRALDDEVVGDGLLDHYVTVR